MKPLKKIIVLLIVAIVLVAIMITLIKISNNRENSWFDFGIRTSYIYSDGDKYSVGGAEIEGEINKLDLSWIAGNVIIEESDTDKIIISETSSEEIDDEYKLRYMMENGKLTIKYCKSGYINWFKNVKAKSLTVKIPKQYLENMSILKVNLVSADMNLCDITSEKVDINSVSGNININILNGDKITVDTVSGVFTAKKLVLKNVDIDSVSGTITIEDCIIEEKFDISTVSGGVKVQSGEIANIDIDTTSGKTTVVCIANTFNCGSVSGNIKAEFKNCPKDINIDTTSGTVEIIIPDNDGFTISCSTVSGDVNIEGFATIKNGKKYVYKNGDNFLYNIDTVSGDIKLKLAN